MENGVPEATHCRGCEGRQAYLGSGAKSMAAVRGLKGAGVVAVGTGKEGGGSNGAGIIFFYPLGILAEV